MVKRKIFKLKLLAIICCLSLVSCAVEQDKNLSKNAEIKQDNLPENAKIESLLKKQILLTNSAKFSNSRNLEGASGFLIKYNDVNFAVTARHLLGEDGGVHPEVKINELDKDLVKWEMLPRVVSDANKQTIKLTSKGLDFSNSINDIVLLKVTSDTFDLGLLTPNFNIPSSGDSLFVIGCPYSERQCKQNYYKVNFIELYEKEDILFGEIFSNVDLTGFSGAPLVNRQGEVVGILVGGGENKGKFYVSATPIREIQKIKF